MVLRPLAMAVLLILLAWPVSAERPDWLGAIENWVASFNRDRGDITLSLEGLALEEDSDAAALVVFEALRLTFGKAGIATSGPGRLRLAEQEEGLLAFGPAALSAPVTVLKSPAAAAVTWDFDLKRLQGLLDPERRLVRQLDLLLESVVARTGEISRLRAQRMALQGEITPGERGRYDQAALFTIQGLEIRAPDGHQSGLERLVVNVATKDSDPDAMIAWAERMQGAGSRQARDPLPPLDALWRESSVSFLLAGLWAKDAEARHLFWLEDLGLETAVERGSAIDRVTLAFLLEGSGLDYRQSADDSWAKAAGFMPTAWRLPLIVEDIPSDVLGSLLLDIAAGGSPQKGPVIDFEPLFQAMRQAGTRLIVEGLSIAGPAVSLEVGGEVTLDRRHPLGMVGEASFLLGGIEEAAAALQESDDPHAARVAFILSTFLKGLGQAEVGDGGRIVHRYDLQFTADGRSLLNDLPLDRLLGR